jgi:hypothetical protein
MCKVHCINHSGCNCPGHNTAALSARQRSKGIFSLSQAAVSLPSSQASVSLPLCPDHNAGTSSAHQLSKGIFPPSQAALSSPSSQASVSLPLSTPPTYAFSTKDRMLDESLASILAADLSLHAVTDLHKLSTANAPMSPSSDDDLAYCEDINQILNSLPAPVAATQEKGAPTITKQMSDIWFQQISSLREGRDSQEPSTRELRARAKASPRKPKPIKTPAHSFYFVFWGEVRV